MAEPGPPSGAVRDRVAGGRPRRGGAPAAVLAAIVALPLGALAVRALADEWRAPALLPQRWGGRGLEVALQGTTGRALLSSLLVAVLCTAVALLLAWPAARALAERPRARTGTVLLLLAGPLLVPTYATGTGLVEWLIRLRLDGTLAGLVLAHLTFVLPYVVAILVSGFGPRLVALEEVARTAGLGAIRRLGWVTLPAAAPTVALAALTGFLVSWGDYGASLAVGAGRPMLPLVLLPFVGPDPQAAATLSLLFLAPAIAALGLAVRAGARPL